MKKYIIISAFIFISMYTLNKANTKPSDLSMKKNSVPRNTQGENRQKGLLLTAQGENIKAEIRVNDIPICRISPKYSSCVLKVTDYLESGDNSLTIITTDSKHKIWARITEHYKDEKIKFYDSKGFNNEKRIGELVKVTEAIKTAIFSSSLEGIKWQWKNNDILNDKEDRQEAINFAKSVYASLQKGESKKIMPLYEPLHENRSITTGVAIDAFKKKSEKMINAIPGNPKPIWKWDNIDAITIVPVKIANARLYDLRRIDGSPFLRTSQEDKFRRITFSNKIGKKNGKWLFFLK